MIAIAGAQVGSIAIRTDNNNNYVLSALPASTLSNWIALATPLYVSTVNGYAGPNVVLTTNDVAEGTTNKYFTDARVRNAISATAPLNFNTTSGVLSMTAASGSSDGYLSSADFTTFNNKQTALTAGVDYATPSGNITGNAANVTGIVSIANGGTGTSTAAGALVALGAEPSDNKSNDILLDGASTTKFPTFKAIKDYVDQQSANAGVADNSITSAKINGTLAVLKGGTGASTAAGARTNLGLVIGTDVMAANATTALTGDVTGSGNGSFATTVNSVGGVSSSTIATLPTNVAANTASITANTNSIATLNTNVAANTVSITANATAIATNTASIATNATAITNEATTARAAELTLTNSVNANTASITSNANSIATLNTNVSANTASISANSTDIATINTNLALKAPLASPAFTGTPTAPTPATSDNSTKVATTEYVKASITAANAGLSSIGAISGTSNANGATISGTTQLILTPADATNGGIVTSGTQTFAGAKTFNNDITVREISFGFGTYNKTNNIAIGRLALNSNNSDYNVAIGNSANSQAASTSGGYNVALGYQAMRFPNSRYNVAIGSQSFYSSAAPSSGDNNVAVGYQAFYNPGTGANNTVLGFQSLYNGGANNSILGAKALYNAAGASNNVAVGDNAGLLFGAGSGTALTSSTQSIFIGSGVRAGTNTSTNEIAIGYNVVGNGSNTVTIGNYSNTANYFRGDINLTGNVNGGTWSGTTIGSNYGGAGTVNGIMKADGAGVVTAIDPAPSTGQFLTSAAGGTYTWTAASSVTGVPYTGATQAVDLGAYDLKVNGLTIGRGKLSEISNTGVGIEVLNSVNNSSGGTALTAVGYRALKFNTSGNQNSAFGYMSLYFNNTGGANSSLGSYSLFSNTTGGNNSAFGAQSLYSNSTGQLNSALGSLALYNNNYGSRNTAIGYKSLYSTASSSSAGTDGNYNTALGFMSGNANTTGSNNTFLGYSADAATASLTNATAIGNGAIVNASNTVQIGNYSVTSVVTSGTISATGFTGPLTGNASSATKLAATKNINGIAFDGSADITIAADANTLTGTTLASNVTASSLTSVGTITSGIWSATTIDIAKGGTGATTAADARTNLGLVIGTDVMSANATTTLTGDVTGAGNGSFATTLAASGVSSGTYGSSTAIPVLTVDTKGRVTSASTVGIIAGVNSLNYTSTSSYASGGTISGTSLTLAAADATNPGLISTGAQTIAGAKTFSSDVTATNFLGNATTATLAGDITATSNTTLTSLQNLNTVGTIISGVWSGTAIANNKLANSTTTLGSTTMTLGGTVTSVTGLTSLAATNLTGALTGNASSATALATGRTISTTGDVTYTSGSFDGSADVTGIATLAASGVSSGTYGSSTAIPVLTVDTKGRVTSASTVGIIAGVNSLNYTSTSSYASGGTISGTSLTLAAADATNPGLISTGAQTIAGAKTFSSDVTATNFLGNASTATTAGNITATSNTSLTSLTNLATVGTITAGTWSATEIALAKGGTGATTASGARANLGLGSIATKSTIADADVDASAAIAFSKLNITKTNIIGLGVQEGLTAGSGISISSGTISATGLTSSNLASNAAITNSQLANSTTTLGNTIMTLGGTVTSVTGLTSLTATTVVGNLSGTATTSTNIAGGLVGSIPYQTAAGTTALLAGNTTSTVKYLASSGNGTNSTAPTWVTPSFVPYTGATAAVDLGAYDLTVNGLTVGRGNTGDGTNTAFGASALLTNTGGVNNTAVGYNALKMTNGDGTTGSYNVALGYSTLSANTTGSFNIASGAYTLGSNTSGSKNSAFGNQSLRMNTTGGNNVGFGFSSLYNVTTASDNTSIGTLNGIGLTTGAKNTFIGSYAGSYFSTGNTSASYNTTGQNSVLIGYDVRPLANGDNNEIVLSGYNGTAGTVGLGTNTTLIGNSSTTKAQIYGALTTVPAAAVSASMVAGENSVIEAQGTSGGGTPGSVTLKGGSASSAANGGNINLTAGNGASSMTGGNINLTPGTGALSGSVKVIGADLLIYDNSFRVGKGKGFLSANTVLGNNALNSNTTGNSNTAIGSGTLYYNTTGGSNTAVGSSALGANTTGGSNTALGQNALNKNTTGTDNVAIGSNALGNNTTGNYNIGIGSLANGEVSSANSNNIGIGWYSLRYNNADRNIGIGYAAGGGLGYNSSTAGANNIFLGFSAGYSAGSASTINTTGENSVLIGYDVRPADIGETNEIVISGYNGTSGTVGQGSHTTSIGNSSTTTAVIYGSTLSNLPSVSTTGSGGDFTLKAQNAKAIGNTNGGNIILTPGTSYGTTGTPGKTVVNSVINVVAGTATASANGLSSSITAQNAGTGNQNGGDINLTPGTATGTGTAGIVKINGQVQITGGSPGAGEVLMSDANGLATWSNAVGSTVVTSTTSYAITLAEAYVFYTGTSAGTFSIPAAAAGNAGKAITIKNKTAFGITITPASGTIYIDNANSSAASVSVGIEASNNWIKLVSDGTQWNVIRALF
jgi:hypothetical protein